MLTFQKDSELIELKEGNRIHINLSMGVDKMESSYLVNIPAINVFFYTKEESEIDQSAHESIGSFFKYWISEQGMEKLITHILSLGFTLRHT